MSKLKVEQLTQIPTVDIDPFGPQALASPVSFGDSVREAGPIVWLSAHKTYGVGGYQEASAILKDNANFTSAGGVGLADIRKPDAWRPGSPIVEVDPPTHTQVRDALTAIISPRVIRGWRESFAAEAESLCDDLLQRNEIDAVRELVERYVFKVFPHALGVVGDAEKLRIVGDHNFNGIGPRNDLFHASLKAQERVADWFENSQKREAMIPGGFGQLIFEAEDNGALPPHTASLMLRSLLRGGSDTTISGIGSTLLFLAQHPDQCHAIKANPALLKLAFEEALRLESPARSLFRTTTSAQEVIFLQHHLMPNTKIQVFLGAANRDPRKWENAGVFDASRKPLGHMAFGAGIHNCVGQMIARMEMECLLGSFMRRVDRIELAGEPHFRLNNNLRTLDTLPLRVFRA